MSTVCPHCGRPMIPKSARFPHVRGARRSRVVELIDDHPGISGEALMDALYADDPDGGASSRKIIAVLVYHARKQITQDGYKIESSVGRGGGYRIVPI
jgi:hypothetical protein